MRTRKDIPIRSSLYVMYNPHRYNILWNKEFSSYYVYQGSTFIGSRLRLSDAMNLVYTGK